MCDRSRVNFTRSMRGYTTALSESVHVKVAQAAVVQM